MQDENKDNKTKRLIETLESNSLRAVDIVDSILTDEGGTSQNKRKIRIPLLIEELKNSLKSITPANVNISFEVNDDLELITGNYSDLYRVFLNLCINSSEAIEGEGNVIVKAENVTSDMISNSENKTSSKYIKISVNDNGSGIEEKNIKKVFESDFSTKNKNYNSGLGLNIVREIILNHDGIIDIESKWGVGTTITTYLPAREELAPQKQKKSSHRILIADDEEDILELLIDLFESYGYEVLNAKDGKGLIDIVKKNNDIDLYIIDRKMPAPDGLECIEIIRKMGIEKPIILTTGSRAICDDPALQELDITQILAKPYEQGDLLNLVDGLLN
jgi:CheY-like chemotaxis protein/anti-sigma regulatory factor (Ser/Thr protein kinase)